MAVRQYIGARYVPQFFEGTGGSPEWVSGVEYEPLTIVTYLNNSYTSKKTVPANIGNPAANPEYWAATGNYNLQVEEYRQEVLNAINEFNAYKEIVALANVREYGAVGDGVTDDTAAFQRAVNANLGGILIPDGTYLVDSIVRISGKDHFTILNYGKLIRNTNTHAVQAMFQLWDVSNLRVEGVIIDGQKTGTGDNRANNGSAFEFLNDNSTAYSKDIVFHNCTINNWCGRGIILNGGRDYAGYISNVIVSDCRFYNVYQGVTQSGVNNSIICNSHFEISITEHLTIDNGSLNNIVIGCILIDHYGGIGAIGSNGAQHFVIANNVFKTQARNNTFSNTENDAAIHLDGRSNTDAPCGVISGNSINNFQYGIISKTNSGAYTSIRNTSIVSNTILGIVIAPICIEAAIGMVNIKDNTMSGTPIFTNVDGSEQYNYIRCDFVRTFNLEDVLIASSGIAFVGTAHHATIYGNIVSLSARINNAVGNTDILILPDGIAPVINTRGYNCVAFTNKRIQYAGEAGNNKDFFIEFAIA